MWLCGPSFLLMEWLHGVHLAYVLSCLHSSGSQDVEGGKMESRGGSL